jgi:hypothetical protein
MCGSDLASELLFQVWIESFHLEVFQFYLAGKVDVAKRMANLSHHGIEARCVHAISLVKVVGHSFLMLFLLLGPTDGGINLD